MSKRKLWLGIIILSIIAFLTAGCDRGEEVAFGIFLVDSGELVLSEQHIKAYHKDTHKIELNVDGIQKWNSYMTYQTIPKLDDSLYSRDFMLRIEGKEIYRGKFYSSVSSASCSEVVILDALVKLDESNNTILIEYGYAWPVASNEEDPRNSPEVISYLEKQGLLE